MLTIKFLNGEFPRKKLVDRYLIKSDYIIAADGGANYLKSRKILPDLIIGDLDSIGENHLSYFRDKNVKIIKLREQKTTDFEKSLNYCLKNNLDEIIVFGASSMRPDHTFNNLSVLKRYYRKLNIKFISGEFEIFYVNKSIKFDYKPGETVSFLAFPAAKGVRTGGLKYRLRGESLEFGKREGTLNVSVSKKISIEFESGNLLLFRKHFLN